MGQRRRRGLSYLPPKPRRTPVIFYFILAAGLLGAIFIIKQNMVKSVSGDVIDAYSGQPISNAVVTIKNDAILARSTSLPLISSVKTDSEGHFLFPQTTEKYTLKVEAINYRPTPVTDFDRVYASQFRLTPYILRGVVKDSSDKPVKNASVTLDDRTLVTGAEGDFNFTDAPPQGKLVVKAPGFRRTSISFEKTVRQDVELKPFVAKGIYLPASSAADREFFPNVLNLFDKTEINALVIDMKDESGRVFYDSREPLAKIAPDSKGRIPNLADFIKNLHNHNIYVIARQVVFLDPVLTDVKPEWSLKSKSNGKLWADSANYNWANPYKKETWDFNLRISQELAEAGFDEIQFDYVRFPALGNLGDINYERDSDLASRVEAVNGFLKKARDTLTPYGVTTSVTIFGLAALQADDLGVGTKLDSIVDNVDFVSLTLYPSSWSKGSFGFDQPASKPFEVIRNALVSAKVILKGHGGILRPWLQDFSLEGITYGPKEIREEIKGAESDNLADGGWLLWNGASRYTAQALNPKSDSGNNTPLPPTRN